MLRDRYQTSTYIEAGVAFVIARMKQRASSCKMAQYFLLYYDVTSAVDQGGSRPPHVSVYFAALTTTSRLLTLSGLPSSFKEALFSFLCFYPPPLARQAGILLRFKPGLPFDYIA